MRRSLRQGLSLFVVLLVCATTIPAAYAQRSSVTVYLELQDRSTGNSLTDSCFVLENASNEGCDENGDGLIRFQDIAPGAYTVRQTRESTGFLPIGDFTITVDTGQREQSFLVATFPDTASSSRVDMRLASVDAASGRALTGGCFIFEGGSNEGCDENGDGIITFDDMSVGAYHLVSTATPDGYKPASARWTGVTRSETFTIEFAPANVAAAPETSDIALVTRDPETSELVTGTCYVLLDFSNEGCDENSDGRVTFKDVPVGLYDVRQTFTPDGYPAIDTFRLAVDVRYSEQGLVVRQSRTQNDGDQRNVSILIRDVNTGELITDSGVCLRIGDYSGEGCDDNQDGQIDFLDIPIDIYQLHVTRRPNRGTLSDEPSIAVGHSISTVLLEDVTIDRGGS